MFFVNINRFQKKIGRIRSVTLEGSNFGSRQNYEIHKSKIFISFVWTTNWKYLVQGRSAKVNIQRLTCPYSKKLYRTTTILLKVKKTWKKLIFSIWNKSMPVRKISTAESYFQVLLHRWPSKNSGGPIEFFWARTGQTLYLLLRHTVHDIFR